MGRINTARVIAGGLVAGVVMNAIDFVVNGVLLASEWELATVALGIDTASVQGTATIGWILFGFLSGLFVVWLYAAIRPRFAPGPRTASIASLAVWAITNLAFASFVFMGLYPLSVVASSAVGGLVATLAAGQAGCRLYLEPASAA